MPVCRDAQDLLPVGGAGGGGGGGGGGCVFVPFSYQPPRTLPEFPTLAFRFGSEGVPERLSFPIRTLFVYWHQKLHNRHLLGVQ